MESRSSDESRRSVIVTAVHSVARCVVAALVAAALGGCVGLVRTQLDWVTVRSEVTTKADVLARFGEPRRRMFEAGRDVWYYHLFEPGPSGRRPATEGATIVYALLAPLWWRAQPDDNTRFAFDGDTVAEARELRTTEGGFFCGVNLAYRGLFSCGPVP
jgi:hypothetical protein